MDYEKLWVEKKENDEGRMVETKLSFDTDAEKEENNKNIIVFKKQNDPKNGYAAMSTPEKATFDEKTL